MKIKKILLFTSMFVVLSCSEKQVWQEIETGKTIKVFPESLESKDPDYVGGVFRDYFVHRMGNRLGHFEKNRYGDRVLTALRVDK